MDRFFSQNLPVPSHMIIDYVDFIFPSQAFAVPSDILLSRPLLLDSGIDFKALKKINSEIYTTVGVIYEDVNGGAPYWSNELLEDGRILDNYTSSDIRSGGGVVWVNGNGTYEGEYTSITSNTLDVEMCPKNNSAVTLTNNKSGVRSHLCSHVSDVDIGILIHATAFPFWVVTNDKCLLWCSASLGSYRQDGRTKSLIRSYCQF